MLNNVSNILGMSPIDFMAALIVLFTALPVHEYAHAAMADRLGDDTPYKQGRLSLSPFDHLSVWGSLSLFFFGFGWARSTEIDSRNFKNPKAGMALCAIMGPLSNFIMALIATVAFRVASSFIVSYSRGGPAVTLTYIFYRMIELNLMIVVFNLIPIPPLDGSKLFNALLPNRVYYNMIRYESVFVMVLVILLYTGILNIPMNWLMSRLMNFLFDITQPVSMLFK